MDVIGFPCVSLDSSTVQVHDSLGSRRACPYSATGFGSQNGEEYTTEAQRSVVRILWAKGFNAKDIYNKYFLLTVGSVCCVKRSTTVWQIFL
jgi:hypothetical protein